MHIKKPSNKTNFLILLIIIVLVANLPNMIYYMNHKLYIHIFLSYIINFCLLSLPLMILFKNIKIYFILLIPIFSTVPLAIISVLLAKSQITSNIILLIFESSVSDQLSYLEGWTWILICIYILYIFLLIRLILKISIKKITFKYGSILSIISLMILVFILFGLKYSYPQIPNVCGLYFPFNLIEEVKGVLQFRNLAENYNISTDKFVFNATKKDSQPNQEIYIFILGESARYDR